MRPAPMEGKDRLQRHQDPPNVGVAAIQQQVRCVEAAGVLNL